MPKSKHRRKAGGKSATHPGRGNLWRVKRGNDPFWQFHNNHVLPFHREFLEKRDAGFIMDLLGDCWTPEAQAVCTKPKLLAEFIAGDDDEDPLEGEEEQEATARGEAAIEWLRDRGWIAVDGEDVRIIPRESGGATRV